MSNHSWTQQWWQNTVTQLLGRSTIFAATGLLAVIIMLLLDYTATSNHNPWLPAAATMAMTAGQLLMLRLPGSIVAGRPDNIWHISWMTVTVLHGALWGINLLPLMHILEGGVLLGCIATVGAWALSAYPPAALAFNIAIMLPAIAQFGLGLISTTELHPLTPAAIFICITLYIMVVFCTRLWLTMNTTHNKIQQLETSNRRLNVANEKSHIKAMQLNEITMRDPLTGIANRRRLDEFISREWSRARRNQTPLAVIYADIDHFKQFNDSEGHAAGDERLCQIAKKLEDAGRRGGDLAARYGGEEFVLVLADTNLEQASAMAERIRANISNLNIPHSGNQPYDRMTISLGVASITPDANSTVDELLSRADKALYKAKNRGRNCVVQI